jgi:hypothetical protein
VECIDWLNETRWSHGPICKETGEPLSMIFGKDNFMYCGLEIPNETIKEEFVKLAKLTSENSISTLPFFLLVFQRSGLYPLGR